MIVCTIGFHLPSQMPFIENNNVIQTLSPDRSDNAFHIRILPRRARSRKYFFDAETFHSMSESITVDAITVAKQIAWSGIKRECLNQLLSRPHCGWVRCNIEVHDVTTVMAKHDKDIKNAKCGSRYCKEIDTGYTVSMVFEKRWLRQSSTGECPSPVNWVEPGDKACFVPFCPR